jgi:hypothetical protein
MVSRDWAQHATMGLRWLTSYSPYPERTSARKLFFRPFPKLLNLYGEDALRRVQTLQDQEDYTEAGVTARKIAGMALEGLIYYDTYDQTRLRSIVSLGYWSFGIYTLLYVRHVFGAPTPTRVVPINTVALDVISVCVAAVVLAGAAVERSPRHALYAAFPIYLIRAILIYTWETDGEMRLSSFRSAMMAPSTLRFGAYPVALSAMAVCMSFRRDALRAPC